VLAFPEAVTLTEILTDLNWRRHVAMVLDHDLDRFYQHVARNLGESAYPRFPASHDPLTGWAARHRDRFAATRKNLWAQARGRPRPFSEIRHFK
jgi:hypothetical protein